ncbi:Tctex1 domain-containing protein 2, partial [Podochytrium sp. JEL0797]
MEATVPDNQYSIRPNYKQKFKQAVVTRLIHQILTDRLTGVAYQPDACSQWTREISDEIKAKLK